jgi:uncharacterized cysteine cluster protein YcgN (CxxCxxCC family)
VRQVPWLPKSCAYRRRAEDKPIPAWHPLLHGGDPTPMLEAGACVAGRCVSENVAGPLEHHLADWGEP